MSGKPESFLEKILKPVRISPQGFFAGILSLGGYALVYFGDGPRAESLGGLFGALGSAFCPAWYLFSITNYREHNRFFKKHGFDSLYAKSRMKKYCDRQPLYVSAVKAGFRDEIKKSIIEKPKEEKEAVFMPHF